MSLELAQQFASHLDKSQFAEAGHLLAEDCKYCHSEGNYQGRNNIINIYRQLSLQTRKLFDEVEYSSSVRSNEEGTYQVLFTDKMRKGHRWHEYHFFQNLTIQSGMITDIQHHEIPGEMESLRVFFNSRSNPSSHPGTATTDK